MVYIRVLKTWKPVHFSFLFSLFFFSPLPIFFFFFLPSSLFLICLLPLLISAPISPFPASYQRLQLVWLWPDRPATRSRQTKPIDGELRAKCAFRWSPARATPCSTNWPSFPLVRSPSSSLQLNAARGCTRLAPGAAQARTNWVWPRLAQASLNQPRTAPI